MSHGEVRQIEGKRVASPEYRSWQLMKNRCLNRYCKDYRYYGGRGITLDPRWHEFDAFLSDLGRRPTLLHTLDRRDNNGHYNKDNCHWATRKEQARNRNYCRLTSQDAVDIRLLYKTGWLDQYDLAILYKVTQTSISQVVRGVTWTS